MPVRQLTVALGQHPSGTCAHCLAPDVPVTTLGVLTDEAHGETEPLCLGCLTGHLCLDLPLTPLAEGPVLQVKGLRQRKKRSQKQEREVAARFDARVQPASGALPSAKGDVRKRGALRIEAKFTEHETFALPLAALTKVEQECLGLEKPVLVVDFVEKGTRKLRASYAVVPSDHLKELLDAAGHHR